MAVYIKHGDFTFNDEKIHEIAKNIEVVNRKKAFWRKFVTNDTMKGDKLTIRRQILIDPTAVATLAEGGTPKASQIKITTFDVECHSYGSYIPHTREAIKKNRDGVIELARPQLAHERLYDLEAVRSTAYVGSTNTIAKDSDDTFADLFDNAGVRLFKNGGKKDGASYVVIMTPELAKQVKKEALKAGSPLNGTDKGAELAAAGYIGTYNEFEIYKCADSCLYGVGQDAGKHYMLFIAKTDDGKWPVIARDADEGNVDVIVKEIGSAGSNDPLDQYGTIGSRIDDIGAGLEHPELVLKCAISATTLASDIPGKYELDTDRTIVSPTGTSGEAGE